MTPTHICRCGHLERDHIRDTGSCHPGFACHLVCTEYSPVPLPEATVRPEDIPPGQVWSIHVEGAPYGMYVARRGHKYRGMPWIVRDVSGREDPYFLPDSEVVLNYRVPDTIPYLEEDSGISETSDIVVSSEDISRIEVARRGGAWTVRDGSGQVHFDGEITTLDLERSLHETLADAARIAALIRVVEVENHTAERDLLAVMHPGLSWEGAPSDVREGIARLVEAGVTTPQARDH